MIKKIGVIGSGTMGHSIAETFALSGYEVNLYDVNEEALEKAKKQMRQELELFVEEGVIVEEEIEQTLQRIRTYTSLKEAVEDRDFVIEAAPEKMELKQNLFKQMDEMCPASTIFASNTSSLPLAGMMEKVTPERKTKMMVNHWYNPGHIMPIVELSFFGNMPKETYDEVEGMYQKAKKQTVKVLKDVPGLVANRIQQGVAREVFSIIEQGIAEPEDIDKALMFGPAFRYATTGQLEVADFGGLDIWCTVGDNLLAVMDNRQSANPLLHKKVEAGKLGIKSGEGFFKYETEEIPKVQKNFMKKLIHQLKASEYYSKK